MTVRELTNNIDDAVSILGGDDDRRRELLLFILLHTDPRDPIGEAVYKEVIGKLYVATPHGQESLKAYKETCAQSIFPQDEKAHPTRAQASV